MKPIVIPFKFGKTEKDIKKVVIEGILGAIDICQDNEKSLRDWELRLKEALERINYHQQRHWIERQTWPKEAK